MITQAIKGWLQKVFAWWPWKQSTPMEYQPVTSAVTWNSMPETPFRSTREGTIPQTGITPRLSTLEGRSERMTQPRSEDFPPSATSASSTELTNTSGGRPPHTPTTQQRLEFLRYLIQRGIVNEGFGKDPTDL
ncbi:MAG: hypothetical protein ACRDHW_10085 [Ktedonobacteraceae bacterium]